VYKLRRNERFAAAPKLFARRPVLIMNIYEDLKNIFFASVVL